MRQESFLW
jgi:ABC-type multidrug transport system, permease component